MPLGAVTADAAHLERSGAGGIDMKFNKELKGFPVRVHSPKQAQEMHEAVRSLEHGEGDLPEKIDVGSDEAKRAICEGEPLTLIA